MTTQSVLADALQLSAKQRLALAEKLWESLRADPELVPVTDAQRGDLRRRLEEYKKDTSGNLSWREAKRQVRSRK
jgi:putative addiction module component (TIGR02574 family)